MRCKRYLDMKTAGASIYPLLDSGMGFGDEGKIACFSCVLELKKQLISLFLAPEWC